MSDEEKTLVVEMHAHFEAVFEKARDVPPEVVALGIHHVTDDAITKLMTRPRHDDVKCRAGCAGCCHINVTITAPEAALLHQHAKEIGLPINRAKLQRQAAVGDDPMRWHELAIADQACVFLGDNGRCSVYEHRPDACRKHFALSDPEHCDPIKHPGHEVLNFVSIEAEVVASAALTVFEAGSMADMLLKEWKSDADPNPNE